MQNFDTHFLDNYVPFGDLPSGDRMRLVQKIEVVKLDSGDQLYAPDVKDWLVYLLEGKVDVCHQYQQPQLLSHTDEAVRQPLFTQHDEQDLHIVALNDCKLFRIARSFFNKLLDQEVLIAESSGSEEMDTINATIYNQILQAVESNQLLLPSLPEVALRVKQAIVKETAGVNEIARIIESDPAMVMRLIQVANSPICRGVEPINSIRDAIVRMGLSMTQNLVVGLAVKQLFKTQHAELKKRMAQLYAHSVEVAAISFALARKTGQLDPDQLLLAGLVHDIGVLPIIAYIEASGLEIRDAAEVENIIVTLRASVGSMVIKNWDFPNEMINVVEQAENWLRHSGEKLDMTDIIIAAQIYSMLQHKQVRHLPDITKVPVFKKLFPEKPDPRFAMEVLAEANEEINEVRRLLHL